MRRHLLAFLLPACLLATTCYGQAVLIEDDFEIDSESDYTVVDELNGASGDLTPDSDRDFSFDYITAGLPLAPNSEAGDTGGLRFAVNETSDDLGAADHITAFHNTSITAAAYELTVDVYMGVETAGGTTEMSTVGIGSDATDFNSIFTPIAGNGQFLSMTGEGGSSSDFRHYIDGTPVSSGDSSYLNSDNTTNATGDTYQALFPSPPYDFAGSPGNSWTTVTISVNANRVLYSLDGTPIIQAESVNIDGFIGLGYTDPFSSVGPHFVVFDNLTVTEVPEPSTGLLGLVAATLLGVRGRRV